MIKAIENRTLWLVSERFLWAALFNGCLSSSADAGQKGEEQLRAPVGPSMVILGLYNELMQVAGSD
jgi:hypothetical protein